jgi:hypothetical protein
MWVEIKTTTNAIVAEAWQELFEDAGIPCQVKWDDRHYREALLASCRVMVPNSRLHVAEHILERC